MPSGACGPASWRFRFSMCLVESVVVFGFEFVLCQAILFFKKNGCKARISLQAVGAKAVSKLLA